ncbi:Phosphoribosylglycinamide formyltransferase, chloroplastic [Morella rubra]|uniref:Phosphoribosylglycinamide formyltransferase, chloroplastic n=1 Tax=Morella rubra TaxID=262757 RepID=A0A6A1VIM9_9ROSI|nr:Phosphoribosylglycinamide formyltransferase, chloroplastic [Morella rubra]
METQSLFSGFCSNQTIHSFRKTENPFFTALPPPSSACFSQLRKWVSYSIHHSSSQRPWTKQRLRCKNGVENVEGAISYQNDFENEVRRKKLAVFVSGGGSNFRSIHEASLRGSIHGHISVLVTNKRGCGGAQYARDKGIPVVLFPKSKDEPEGLSPTDLVTALRRYKVDFIILAGYLKLIPVELIRAYPRFIVNIHPSLLPAFGGKGYYGMKVHKAVIASGARYSGPTIHFVDEHYDTGRILAQSVVPVLANDTAEELAARVLREEHRLYVEVVAALCEGRIIWREDGVPLIRSKQNPNHPLFKYGLLKCLVFYELLSLEFFYKFQNNRVLVLGFKLKVEPINQKQRLAWFKASKMTVHSSTGSDSNSLSLFHPHCTANLNAYLF